MTWLVNSELIKELRAWFLGRDEPIWRTWTPTITQSVGVTYNAGTSYIKYSHLVSTVHLNAFINITGAGTTNNNIIITPPAGLGPVQVGHVGSGYIFDASTGGIYFGSLTAIGSADLRLRLHSLTTSTFVGVNPNFGLANGDLISFQATYERAS